MNKKLDRLLERLVSVYRPIIRNLYCAVFRGYKRYLGY